MTELTRYYLFHLASNYIKEKTEKIWIRNPRFVADVFESSAILISNMEAKIKDATSSSNDFWNLFEVNYKGEINDDVRLFVDSSFALKERNYRKTYKELFASLINVLVEYQNLIIDNFIFNINDVREKFEGMPQSFLSYAYLDKGLSLSLYIYFLIHGGFLYVNWMWSGSNNNGVITKLELEKALGKSTQLLFLRTTSSELKIRGNYTIRQWCSWEIGNFYTKYNKEKYYISFYDSTPPKNDMLDSFKIMTKVEKGKIV